MKRCVRCLGTKQIHGMGGMKEKCPECNGKGFFAEKEKLEVKEKTTKRGRPKKESLNV